MADLWSIISANYKTVGLTVPSKTPYVAVDSTLYEGNWTGKYADNKTFKFTISNVEGFRAKVQYQSGGTNKFQEVLIRTIRSGSAIPGSRCRRLERRRSRTSSPTRRAARLISIRPTHPAPAEISASSFTKTADAPGTNPRAGFA
jgi:hypothetical protein